jgi:hypothetical protein
MKQLSLITVAIAAIFLSSCKNKKEIVTVIEKETVVVEKVDTLIIFKGDSIRNIQPLSLTKGFIHEVKHDLATIRIEIDTSSGELTTDVIISDREETVQIDRTTTKKESFNQTVNESVKPCDCPSGLWWKIPLLCIVSFIIGNLFSRLGGFLKKILWPMPT